MPHNHTGRNAFKAEHMTDTSAARERQDSDAPAREPDGWILRDRKGGHLCSAVATHRGDLTNTLATRVNTAEVVPVYIGDTPSVPSEPRELLCMKCGAEHPVWYAENPVWNAVVRHADGSDEWPFLCPTCFTVLAAAHGYDGLWAVVHEPSAAVRDGGALDAWQPIESAPRDGRSVIMRIEYPVFDVVLAHWDGRWRMASAGMFSEPIVPTHWTPLPPPPGASREQGAVPTEPACDCHKYEHQVCDICQGVTGDGADAATTERED